MIPSSPPEASQRPSGLNLKQRTSFVCACEKWSDRASGVREGWYCWKRQNKCKLWHRLFNSGEEGAAGVQVPDSLSFRVRGKTRKKGTSDARQGTSVTAVICEHCCFWVTSLTRTTIRDSLNSLSFRSFCSVSHMQSFPFSITCLSARLVLTLYAYMQLFFLVSHSLMFESKEPEAKKSPNG